MQQRLSVRFLVTLLIGLGCLGYVPHVSAALLELSDVPLSLSIKVKPNILFLIDNTGSMDYEVMTKDSKNNGRLAGTQPDGSSPAGSGGLTYGYNDKAKDSTDKCDINTNKVQGYIYGNRFPSNWYAGSPDCTIAGDQEWRFRNSDFNPLYFNPQRIYKPWPGLNPNGQPYANIDIHNAPDDPSDPKKTIDLTSQNSLGQTSDGKGFRYYTWTDKNHNGLFDNGEETEYLIKDADAATQQNFANWFSYHRRRSSELKAVVGDTIANAGTGQRMGLALVSPSATWNTPIRDMNGDATSGTKSTLLQKLYPYKIDNGTKSLLNGLYTAGQYFMNQTSFPGFNKGVDDPYLPADQGGTCQQSFTILLTDGPYDDGNTFNKVGNEDGDGNTSFDCGAYKDGVSHTAADVAMKFYEKDLRSDLADKVPTNPGLDTAKHQHMVTYVLTFGATGKLTS